MCDDKHVPIREPVPEGVTIVQRALCGIPTFEVNMDAGSKKVADPANLAAVSAAAPDLLKALLGSVGIHTGGDPDKYKGTIVKSTVDSLFDWVRPDRKAHLIQSGLIEVPLKEPLTYEINWDMSKGDLKRDDFLRLYNNSVYPTRDEVDAHLTQIGIVGDISESQYLIARRSGQLALTSDLLTVAKRFPGVHYHLTCRSVDSRCKEAAAASRSASGLATGRSKEEINADVNQNLVDRHLEGEDISNELAKIPYKRFRAVFDAIIAMRQKLNPRTEATSILCGLATLVHSVMTNSMNGHKTPERYGLEFYQTAAACYLTLIPPGLPKAALEKAQVEVLARAAAERDMFIEGLKKGEAHGGGRRHRTNKTLWPPKYYRGLSTRRKGQRHREITRRAKMSWKDPKAYRPFATDKGTRRRPSSYSSRFHTKYPGVAGIPAIAKATGVSADTLHKVYNRGMAAWRTGHRPGASPEAWGMARVHSFVLHGKTWRTADKDLAGK